MESALKLNLVFRVQKYGGINTEEKKNACFRGHFYFNDSRTDGASAQRGSATHLGTGQGCQVSVRGQWLIYLLTCIEDGVLSGSHVAHLQAPPGLRFVIEYIYILVIDY